MFGHKQKGVALDSKTLRLKGAKNWILVDKGFCGLYQSIESLSFERADGDGIMARTQAFQN